MYKFGVIGGGLHGIHIATSLLTTKIATIDEIKIIDPLPQLLGNWQRFTSRVGMRFLRSPGVHNLAVDPMALHKTYKNKPKYFASPYSRPSLDAFNQHSAQLVEKHSFSKSHIQDLADHLQMERN